MKIKIKTQPVSRRTSRPPQDSAAVSEVQDSNVDLRQSKSHRSFVPPPPTSWPAKHHKLNQTLDEGTTRSISARMLSQPELVELRGFDEEIEVILPDREATFWVRIAGRELAMTGGVIVALHGVRCGLWDKRTRPSCTPFCCKLF